MNAHYRSPGYYSDQSLSASEKAIARIRYSISLSSNENSSTDLDATEYRLRFISAMDDDLNTPQALAALFDLAREINRESSLGEKKLSNAQSILKELALILGFTLEENLSDVDDEITVTVQNLIQERTELRSLGKYAEADNVRDQIMSLGIEITDTAEGTTWRRN